MRPRLAAAALAVTLSACSGGGGASRLPRPASSPAGAVSSASGRSVTLQLKIPKRSTLQSLARARARAPKWISASTEGAAVTISDTSASGTAASLTTNFSLVPGASTSSPPPAPSASPNASGSGTATCSLASDGSTTCALNAPVPGIGTNLTVGVVLYDTPPAYFRAGNAVASGTVASTIGVSEGSNVVLPLVLSGVVSTVEAGILTTIPATGGSGSFVLQGLDADGNIILASDGADGPNLNSATFNLSVPPSITSVTLTDLTTTSVTSGTTLGGVHLGDTITVAQTGTPAFVGVPLEAIIEDGTPADLGPVYVAVSPTASTPKTLVTLINQPRIAGATFESSFNGGPTANGFVAAYDGTIILNTPEIDYFSVSGGTSPTATKGAYVQLLAANGYFLNSPISDVMVTGNANYTGGSTTSEIYFVVPAYAGGEDLAAIPLNSTYNGAVFLVIPSLNSSNDLNGSYTFTASADAGGYVGTAIAPTSGNAAYANVAAETTIDPLKNFYQVGSTNVPVSIAATINGTSVVGENPVFVILAGTYLYVVTPASTSANLIASLPTNGESPTSLVAHGPSIDVLTDAGTIITCAASASGGSCTYNGAAVLFPSSDRHAMALGPDGALWIATNMGIERYDLSSKVVTVYGSQTYNQIVASADGRLYATVTGTGEIDTIP